MTAAVVHPYPVRRPSFFTSVTWSGSPGDPQLALDLHYTDNLNLPGSVSLLAKTYSDAILCLPTTSVIADLPEDVLIAHVRMCGMIAGAIPGSKEYEDLLTQTSQLDARYFQTPIGDVKVNSVTTLSDSMVRMVMQKGSAATRTVDMPISDLSSYSFAPSTQLMCVAGAIKKQYPTYIQDPSTNKYLTQAQMDTIAAYVIDLDPWI